MLHYFGCSYYLHSPPQYYSLLVCLCYSLAGSAGACAPSLTGGPPYEVVMVRRGSSRPVTVCEHRYYFLVNAFGDLK